MPIFEVMLNGKMRKVELVRETETSFSVRTDDRSTQVRLPSSKFEIGAPCPMEIGGKTYHIEISSIDRDKPIDVKVDGTSFKLEFKNNYFKTQTQEFQAIKTNLPTQKRASELKQSIAEGAVVAPMTGKVMSIKVKKNDLVKINQVLCVVEAMKMENEILSTINGTVQEINVTEGSPVNEGEVLFIIA
jgi:biotin carboxyl carrier protein